MGKVVCQICGKSFTVLNKAHLQKIHGITREEYSKQFPNASLIDPDYKKLIADSGRKARIAYNTSEIGRKRASEFCKKLNQDSERQRKKNQKIWTPERRKLQSDVMKEVYHRIWETDELLESRKKQISGLRGHRGPFRTKDGRVLQLDSYLEGRTVKFFELNSLDFEHEALEIPYFFNGKEHKYYPDFYLRKYNLIVETKISRKVNWKINQVKRKAALDAGYKYVFCTEQTLENWKDFLNFIIALDVEKSASENSADAGKS